MLLYIKHKASKRNINQNFTPSNLYSILSKIVTTINIFFFLFTLEIVKNIFLLRTQLHSFFLEKLFSFFIYFRYICRNGWQLDPFFSVKTFWENNLIPSLKMYFPLSLTLDFRDILPSFIYVRNFRNILPFLGKGQITPELFDIAQILPSVSILAQFLPRC